MSGFSRHPTAFIAVLAFLVLGPCTTAGAQGSVALYEFKGGSDGGGPNVGVTLGRKGTLYGTTEVGGANGWGTVFKIAANGTETPLYSFTGGSDGGQPIGGVIVDKAGNLYGTTYAGGVGAGYDGCGVVFKVTPQGSETALYAFTIGSDGCQPYGGLVTDKSGNLYGTTEYGGLGVGTIFKVTSAGTESVLYSFGCESDGCLPFSGLAIDNSGNLYGTASYGGTVGYGDVFELTRNGTFTTIYSFGGGNDGSDPHATVVLDSAGNIYGTTAYGGGSSCDGFGCGTVYKISPSGNETILHAFAGGSDGMGLFGSVYLDASGNVYGTTLQGGSGCDYGCGTVFQIAPDGDKTTLHAFTIAEGSDSRSGLVADLKGHLYGTTYNAGTYGYGSVFKVKE